MYKQIKIGNGQIDTERIVKIVDGIKYYIPFDEANTDYLEYLEWVSDGNTPDPSD